MTTLCNYYFIIIIVVNASSRWPVCAATSQVHFSQHLHTAARQQGFGQRPHAQTTIKPHSRPGARPRAERVSSVKFFFFKNGRHMGPTLSYGAYFMLQYGAYFYFMLQSGMK